MRQNQAVSLLKFILFSVLEIGHKETGKPQWFILNIISERLCSY